MSDYAVINPATGETLKTYPTITDGELEAAISGAYKTYQEWGRTTSVEERTKLVRRVGELHLERREELAAITVREMGKPMEQALGEVDFCADIYGYYADNGVDLLKDEPIELLAGEGSAVIRRSPYGVLLGPGCSEVGSKRADAAAAEVSGRTLTTVVLALGGSDPFVLLSTTDLDAAVEAAVSARLDNTGQSCNAAKRFIVHEDLYDPFMEKFTAAMGEWKAGDPTGDAAMGPLSSATAAERLQDQLERAQKDGAKVVLGGERKDNFFSPTILADIPEGAKARYEEFFGPVASVYKVGSEEEAVKVANDTPFGLGSYVFTTDAAQAERVANR